MWANMAAFAGLAAADDENSYKIKGHALKYNYAHILPLKWLHAIHNQGHGDAIRGANAAREGVKSGVCDVFLPIPVRQSSPLGTVMPVIYCGLYIEMKKPGKGVVSDQQKEFISFAQGQGYKCEVCYSWQEARMAILNYLQIKMET